MYTRNVMMVYVRNLMMGLMEWPSKVIHYRWLLAQLYTITTHREYTFVTHNLFMIRNKTFKYLPIISMYICTPELLLQIMLWVMCVYVYKRNISLWMWRFSENLLISMKILEYSKKQWHETVNCISHMWGNTGISYTKKHPYTEQPVKSSKTTSCTGA